MQRLGAGRQHRPRFEVTDHKARLVAEHSCGGADQRRLETQMRIDRLVGRDRIDLREDLNRAIA